VENPNEKTIDAPRPDLSAMLEKVLANPEIINMVASAVGGGKEADKADDPTSDTTSDDLPASLTLPDGLGDKLPEIMKALSPMLSKGGGGIKPENNDRRACLLSALKPYLSKERCEAIDYMLALGRISALLKSIT